MPRLDPHPATVRTVTVVCRATSALGLALGISCALSVGGVEAEARAHSSANAASVPDLDSLHATYRYVGGAKQTAALDKAITTAIDGLPPGLYELAYRRISQSQLPSPQIVLDVEGKDIRVERGRQKPIHTTASKTKVVVFNKQGERYVYRQTVKCNTLIQRVTGIGNKTRMTYKLSADGSTLTFGVLIDADLLPRPVTYKLTYKRVGSPG